MLLIASDHAGFELKEKLKQHFDENKIEYNDFGVFDLTSVNYAEIGAKAAKAVADGEFEQGILVCGTGIGMSIAANKVNGIRAAVCSDHFSAKYSRLHNDANILCLGARVIGDGIAAEIADIFLSTAFEGGRHKKRVDTFTKIENNCL
jgi:ribose 5-phosphate isomerase B